MSAALAGQHYANGTDPINGTAGSTGVALTANQVTLVFCIQASARDGERNMEAQVILAKVIHLETLRPAKRKLSWMAMIQRGIRRVKGKAADRGTGGPVGAAQLGAAPSKRAQAAERRRAAAMAGTVRGEEASSPIDIRRNVSGS